MATVGRTVRLESVRYRIETLTGMWRTIHIGGVLVSHHRYGSTEPVEETNEGQRTSQHF